jgi:hypothetical protein
MDQADAQHRAGPCQPRVGERGAVAGIQDVGDAAAGDGAAEHVLAGAGVLAGEEPAVDQQPGVVIDDQEQPGPDRPVPLRERDPGADEDVGDPPLVRPGGLVPAERLRLGGQGLAVQPGAAEPGAAEPGADGPLGDLDPVPVVEDRGDLRGGAARQLQA